jgi:hypothetical protein
MAKPPPFPPRDAPAAGPASADHRGLVCRHCGCRHFRVVYTRPSWGGRIKRRRECRHCGSQMSTLERALA